MRQVDLPDALRPLAALARNLWWSWDHDATALFASIDPLRFENARHNPVKLLADVDDSRWIELAGDKAFVAKLDAVMARFQAYLDAPGWGAAAAAPLKSAKVAYFSMEFGLHESLRIYSGGLGILAGDHLRSASDLNVPLVGITLLYRKGYFRQVVDEGEQIEAYADARLDRLPFTRSKGADGKPLRVKAPLGKLDVALDVWELAVGRTKLYLLDADNDANGAHERTLTHALYGGNHETRIAQEILVGIGGVRALRALGEPVEVYHLNEGHCAFAVLELIRERIEAGETFEEAHAAVKSHCVFTTHTPVPAGHDRFHPELLESALGVFRESLGIDAGTLADLGRVTAGKAEETHCMTVLALKTSAKANGVSALHGRVSREMWTELWPDKTPSEVPIGHVTNGVHPLFWCSDLSQALWDKHMPRWRDHASQPDVWAEGVAKISDEELWGLRSALRYRLAALVAKKSHIHLDPEALTIGFARRFAPYKRGNLLFSDPDRLEALLRGGRGVQIVYSGKAHPRDERGKEIIKEVLAWTRHPRFRGHIAFIEDYDIVVGRTITSGSDVWLNNPRRPHEASGTSGQKVPLNGGINLSILDGWWPEAHDGTNGWTIGDDEEPKDETAQDNRDATALFDVLEREVLPEWNDRTGGAIPKRWCQRIRRSIATCAPAFNSDRMVMDYVRQYYLPVQASATP